MPLPACARRRAGTLRRGRIAQPAGTQRHEHTARRIAIRPGHAGTHVATAHRLRHAPRQPQRANGCAERRRDEAITRVGTGLCDLPPCPAGGGTAGHARPQAAHATHATTRRARNVCTMNGCASMPAISCCPGRSCSASPEEPALPRALMQCRAARLGHHGRTGRTSCEREVLGMAPDAFLAMDASALDALVHETPARRPRRASAPGEAVPACHRRPSAADAARAADWDSHHGGHAGRAHARASRISACARTGMGGPRKPALMHAPARTSAAAGMAAAYPATTRRHACWRD